MESYNDPYDSAEDTEVDVELSTLSYEETHAIFSSYRKEIWLKRREIHNLKQELEVTKKLNEVLLSSRKSAVGEQQIEAISLAWAQSPTSNVPTSDSSVAIPIDEKFKKTCLVKNYVEQNPRRYLKKMTGEKIVASPPLPHLSILFFTFLASFIGISLLGIIHQFWLEKIEFVGIIGSMGAVSTLLFAATSSPLSQPWNLLFGNIMCASIGMGFRYLFMSYPNLKWLAGGLSVALSILMMQATKSVHPPAGATCLIAVLGPEPIWKNGFWYILAPVAIDVVILFSVGLLVLNLSKKIKYPAFWM